MNVCILGDARSVHLQRIIPGLAARGIRVHLITHNPSPVEGATVERFRVPDFGIRHVGRWHGRWRQMLRRLMRRYDVVHVHFLHDWGITPEIAAEGVFLVTPWGSDIVDPPGEDPPSLDLVDLRRALLRCADGVTACGPWFAGAIARFAGIDAACVAVLPLGVDTSVFKPPSPPRSHGRAVLRVGFFKGFRPVYGPTYLIRAIPTVIDVCPDVRFDLVGDGPQRLACVELAARLEVEPYLFFAPPQPHRNVANYLAGWDVSVIPSLCESFGVAALESSAAGVPVVASRVGGLVDTVIHGQTGLLTPPAAPEQLADAIITLLRNPQMRRRMGEEGRRFVCERFEWSEILDEWVETYQRVRECKAVMV
ncbi:MAG: glycosyltransferase family 4 protein [Phycisphaerales bacterium]|nr:MAG: glycosyltransferase family 4 protein [Phycisphaerales bacterium]